MEYIQNPILKGFNPDPSICRVGDDYYIATSTFEWFPGVQIHHSKDLKNWELIARPLNRKSQLNMRGVPDSCGVWAPCLSYANNKFYLVYTNVKSFDGVWKDTPNYVVTADDIRGTWSDPIYLCSSGFDGSFFHDQDKLWFVNMIVDHRNGKLFGGVEMHEVDPQTLRLLNERHFLTKGTKLGSTEGPHLYKRNEYYYLILAEGGTEYNHSATILRSKSVFGPYEEHPDNPILTSKDSPKHTLQKAGHGSMIETQIGDWYIVFLIGRPLTERGRCILGRETAIEEVVWKEDWPFVNSGSRLPRLKVPNPNLEVASQKKEHVPVRIIFDQDKLPMEFQSLRIPMTENWVSLKERKGFLRLTGRESLTSTHNQSMIARRLQHFKAEVSTLVEFEPDCFQQMSGLVLYYNTGHYHYLHITHRDDDKVLSIISADNFQKIEDREIVVITGHSSVVLKASIQFENLQFSYKLKEDGPFTNIGSVLDISILSDDNVREGSERYRPAFTGSFIGLCCQDLRSNKRYADFGWFEYIGIEE
ncbi:glycoside hydrolase family 43 protein [Aestuariivivens sediminis]|uniref:glycoside hydrolase family 43 protein n=1 Tax=Aestuariivivens sediminis TaxID=2913557 RepID=UPI001F55E5A2|nr:glycoside hydrolase family 43 protein [Aestuariivivens sediminis]